MFIDSLNDPADLVIRVGPGCREHIHLADEQLLLVGRQLIPLLKQVVRPRRELGVRREYAEPLLVGEDGFPEFIPATVEEVHGADLLGPLRSRD